MTTIPSQGNVRKRAAKARTTARADAGAEQALRPTTLTHPVTGVEARLYIGDCRDVLPRIPEVAKGKVDLVFADPPFNWNRAYDEWDDRMKDDEYLEFTYRWL